VGSAVRHLGTPKPRDVLAGLVTGLFSIPEGMAYASIGGFNPVVGLWAGVVPGIVSSVLARTALMGLADFLAAVIRSQQSESAPAWTATMTAACRAGESWAHGVP
jgi:MFS superfamily sulfate permease-like transporter